MARVSFVMLVSFALGVGALRNDTIEDEGLDFESVEYAELESDVNLAADQNTEAFTAVRTNLGVCAGKSTPPSCCCVPMSKRNDEQQQCSAMMNGAVFYPGVQSYGKSSFDSRTCSRQGLCCKTSSAEPVSVRVMEGENRENMDKVYVKVIVGRQEQKTSPASSKVTTVTWNEDLSFSTKGKVTVEVKRKVFMGARSYGTFTVPTKCGQSSQDIDINVPSFGKLSLTITGDTSAQGVDDDFDASLCNADGGPNALLELGARGPSDADSVDAFLAELDLVAPTSEKLSKDTPAFLNVLAHKPNQQASSKLMSRDYTLIIDRSGSMSRSDELHVPEKMAKVMHKRSGYQRLRRWDQVSGALQYLAPYVVAEDPDGVGVYFFDSKWDEAPNICSEKQVLKLFDDNRPGGGTYLSNVLREAMEPDTVGRAETIFILTDGSCSDGDAVARAIIQYTQKMCRPEMLSISFIQVGDDPGAQRYLNSLDDDLEGNGAVFDIVDAMTKDEMDGRSFMDIVELSVHD